MLDPPDQAVDFVADIKGWPHSLIASGDTINVRHFRYPGFEKLACDTRVAKTFVSVTRLLSTPIFPKP